MFKFNTMLSTPLERASHLQLLLNVPSPPPSLNSFSVHSVGSGSSLGGPLKHIVLTAGGGEHLLPGMRLRMANALSA